MPTKKSLIEKLTHLASRYHQDSFIKKIDHFSLDQLYQLEIKLENTTHPTCFAKAKHLPYSPFKEVIKQESFVAEDIYDLLEKQKVAAMILAGGDGSRLGFDGPKGCFLINGKKSLFELHLEKVKALQSKISSLLPIFILVSKKNKLSTEKFFEIHDFFLLKKEQFLFLEQEESPFFDEEKLWLLNEDRTLATGPNGNGAAFSAMKKGLKAFPSVEMVNVINIDNPLATLFDVSLLSHHLKKSYDVTLRCIKKSDPREKVGILSKEGDRLKILDYTATCDLERFDYGNINIFLFSRDFINKVTQKNLPFHLVLKKTRSGKSFYKPEQFITDAIEFADKFCCIESSSEDHFAPLKEKEGAYGEFAVHQAIIEKEKRLLMKFQKDAKENFNPIFYYL
jgi:UDP-N-acetylglucosamine/UDP-N-acetylgalactosamine diphosphorylase